MEMELANKIQIEKRIRYSIWNLISEVGGFSDGITLICNIFMTAYSAMAFKTSFLNRSYYDSDMDPREHKDENYKTTVENLKQGRSKFVDNSLFNEIKRVLEAPNQLKMSLSQNIFGWYC